MTKASKPVSTTSEAGRAVAANALANRQRLAREEAEAKRADIKTPIRQSKAAFEMEELFSNPAPEPHAAAESAEDTPSEDLAPQQKTLVLSVTILHRGRLIKIASEGRTLDAFCDLLDKRFGVAK